MKYAAKNINVGKLKRQNIANCMRVAKIMKFIKLIYGDVCHQIFLNVIPTTVCEYLGV